jgi:hypothetical protein
MFLCLPRRKHFFKRLRDLIFSFRAHVTESLNNVFGRKKKEIEREYGINRPSFLTSTNE